MIKKRNTNKREIKFETLVATKLSSMDNKHGRKENEQKTKLSRDRKFGKYDKKSSDKNYSDDFLEWYYDED